MSDFGGIVRGQRGKVRGGLREEYREIEGGVDGELEAGIGGGGGEAGGGGLEMVELGRRNLELAGEKEMLNEKY